VSFETVLSDEHRLFSKAVHHFLDREVAPHAEAADRTGDLPPGLVHRLGELGYLGLRYPEDVGGSGAGFVAVCLLMEEFYRVSAGMAAVAEIQCGLGTMPLFLAGTEEQKERYLRPALAGELLGAFALTEPDAGSDATSIATAARRAGSGWVLQGSKTYITNGSRADFLIVAARTGEAGAGGVSLFVVDRRLGEVPARRIETLGLRASDTSEVFLDDVQLPADALLGEEGSGFAILMRTLNEGRIMVGAESVGLATAALEAAVGYAKTRQQFGSPIGAFQSIRFRLADMATQVAASRLLVYRAAQNVDEGTITREEASMAKLFASEVASHVTKDALYIHGGFGYMMEAPLQRYFRDSVANEIVEGTSDMQRESIARSLGL
jgi:alkylation response protein AidB-like acyl-CoA dehydrogenase